MNILKKVFYKFFKELSPLLNKNVYLINNSTKDTEFHEKTKFYKPYRILNSKIDKGTYISENAKISFTQIGKFCSIGPNFVCGWGIHPIEGISTSPYFYSTKKQNGFTIAKKDLIEERKSIFIGNDVFIGANVTILDGVKIGDGAVIGAGSVVSKNIPDYAVAYGVPIKIVKFRFDSETIKKLKEIKWWDFDDDRLFDINRNFFDINNLLNKY